ncbi:MAG: DUF6624 domain-containing protein [Bacteroidota bacterium]
MIRIIQNLLCLGLLSLFLFIGCKQEAQSKIELNQKQSSAFKNQAWADSLIIAFKNFMIKKDMKAGNQLFNAAELMPVKNWEVYMLSATIFANSQNKDRAFIAIKKAIESGFEDHSLLKGLPDLAPLHNDVRWEKFVQLTLEKQQETLEKVTNPNLLQELKKMWANDQAVLSKYQKNIQRLDSTSERSEYERLFKPVEMVWDTNRRKLDSIIDQHGWPGDNLVGKEGSKLSWAIPQHHPDIFFKRKCLKLIERAMLKSDVDPNYFAELNDRIARDIWLKQTYGASMGDVAPHPIANPSEVNQKRYELGLTEPIEVYAILHGIEYRSPSKAQAKKDSIESKKIAQKHFREFQLSITRNKVEVANTNLKKAIDYYGDISDEQLFEAAFLLSKTENSNAQELSTKILKVLIWREWEHLGKIRNEEYRESFSKLSKWDEINSLLEKI